MSVEPFNLNMSVTELKVALINSNCAGIIGPHQTTDSMDIDAFNKTIRINTIGVLTCMKYQIQQMKCQEPIKLYVISVRINEYIP